MEEREVYFEDIPHIPSAGIRSRHLDRLELYYRWWLREKMKKYMTEFVINGYYISDMEIVEPDIVVGE